MRKYLPYILIIIALVGLFSPMGKVNAQNDPPRGQCTIILDTSEWSTRTVYHQNKTEAECITLKPNVGSASWRANTPCTAPNTPAGCTPAINTGYQLLEPLPCPPNTPGCTGELTSFDTTTGLGAYLNLMIKIVIGLAAVLSVVMIVVGGLQYMTSELVHSKEAGKERIINALFGLVIALGAYALLFTINPDLLKSDVDKNIPNTTVTPTATVCTLPQVRATDGTCVTPNPNGSPEDPNNQGL